MVFSSQITGPLVPSSTAFAFLLAFSFLTLMTDLQHHLALLTLGGKLGLAPPCDPEYKVQRALDIGTGTGIWAIQYADDHPEAEVSSEDSCMAS